MSEILGKILCASCGVDSDLYEVEVSNPPYTPYKQFLCNNCAEEVVNDNNETED